MNLNEENLIKATNRWVMPVAECYKCVWFEKKRFQRFELR